MNVRTRGLLAAGLMAVIGAAALTPARAHEEKDKGEMASGGVLQFKVKDIDGKDVSLDTYRGKVLLIVNTASKCGYTPQYAGLEELYKKHQADGLVVLGFPCNDFGRQEPGSEAEIKKFCSEKYKVTFPMFSKVAVKGDGACDLYKFLTSKETNPRFAGDIKWNFTKFLVDREGNVIGRFGSGDDPLTSKPLTEAVQKALSQRAAAGAGH